MSASPAVLHAVGDRALGWLDANRDRFRLVPGDRETNQALLQRLKPVSELAINTHILFREGVAGSRQRARAGQLLDFTWRELLDGGNVLVGLQRDEPHSPVPLELYSPFHELGYRHPGLERAIALARSTACWRALEALPNRRLGILNAERRVGLTPSDDMEDALRRTWLGRTPEPWLLQYHIAYDVTHTVFHITNWGQAPDRIPPDIADYLTRYLPAWLDDWADLENWDLLGELLVVDGCLPEPALDLAVWERFAAAQSASGAMPFHHGMPDGDPDEVFDLVHHPTLVAAFASAMATSRAMAAA